MSKLNSQVSLPVWLIALGALLALLSIAGVASGVAPGFGPGVVSASPALYDEQVVVSIFDRADPAVVTVNTTRESASRFGFIIPQDGQGSGFLVDAEGHILTNYHVVQDATSISVTIANGEALEAELAGSSHADDIALLKVDAEAVAGITPLKLGDSAAVKPGQMAIALGSPFGLDNSISVGVVSGVNRSRAGALHRLITGMIQTDASLNPGNSGGPMLNSLGEVVGINTSVEVSPITGSIGVGFAVPINTAKDLMAQFVQGETVRRPWVGISGAALSPDLAEVLGLEVSKGVYISTVTSGSPAEEAGLVAGGAGNGEASGDVITAVDGKDVTSVEDIVMHLNSLAPGDSVSLTLLRDGETTQVKVALGEWPEMSN
jgi:S1-C subfamily serine protease